MSADEPSPALKLPESGDKRPAGSESPSRRATAAAWLWLMLGSASFALIGWRYNVPLAAWVAPVFLMRYYRTQTHWWTTLFALPLLAAASYVQLRGAWDLAPWQQYLLPLLRPALVVLALYVDRSLSRRLPKLASTLVFPSVYVALDYLFALTPFGTVLSLSATQFQSPVVAQIASLTGIWGIGFLICWSASVVNLVWEHRPRLREAGAAPVALAAVLTAVMIYGGGRYALLRPTWPTVRVASITVPHPRDYWSWIDVGTPRTVAVEHAEELTGIEDRLFAESLRAVAAGAKIVLWSEGNAVVLPERSEAFRMRAARFANLHQVYLFAAALELHYGSTVSDNKVLLFTPEGKQAYSYVKTKSWYPTDSDGSLPSVATPYGRLASAICFDMDFPHFINRLGRMQSDIVLVPSFDSAGIRPYHTEVGMMRGIENGFSVVRQTNEGTSMAVDGVGHLISRQEFFETDDPIMFADVPIRRVRTLYAVAGDWFAYAAGVLALTLVVSAAFVAGARFRRRPTCAGSKRV